MSLRRWWRYRRTYAQRRDRRARAVVRFTALYLAGLQVLATTMKNRGTIPEALTIAELRRSTHEVRRAARAVGDLGMRHYGETLHALAEAGERLYHEIEVGRMLEADRR